MKIFPSLLAFLFVSVNLHAFDHIEDTYSAKKTMKMPYETIYAPEPKASIIL